MEEIKFDISVKVKDMYHFLMHHFYRSLSGIFGLVLSIGAFILLLFKMNSLDTFQIVILAVLSALFTIVQPIQMWFKAWQQVKLNPVFKKPFSYVISQKGMVIYQEPERVEVKWSDIRKVVETKKCFFVYFTAVNANVIPKSQCEGKTEELKSVFAENQLLKK